MHWNGTQWSVVSGVNPNTQYSPLNGVAALAEDDVWAVGYYGSAGGVQALIEHWDGNTWTIVPSPYIGSFGSKLQGIAALSTNDIWAVGSSHDSSNQSRTLVMHWGGSQWSILPSPNPSGNWNVLNSVTVGAGNNVWAVGYDDVGGGGQYQTLIEHWDGMQWSVIPSPNEGSTDNYLYGAAAISTADVWAVGHYGSSLSGIHSLTLHWDGSQWTSVSNPGTAASARSALFLRMMCGPLDLT